MEQCRVWRTHYLLLPRFFGKTDGRYFKRRLVGPVKRFSCKFPPAHVNVGVEAAPPFRGHPAHDQTKVTDVSTSHCNAWKASGPKKIQLAND